MYDMPDEIDVRADGSLRIITLNRPDDLNAVNDSLHSGLARLWPRLSAVRDARAAVITGVGRAFSAGGDLAMVERMAGDYDRVQHMLREMSDLVYNIVDCDKPIISAINGVAVGAGVVVAVAGVVSIGSMAVVNVLIDSDFKVPLVAVAGLWGLAMVLYWRGR